MHLKDPLISNRQLQVLYGTLLGGSSLVKSSTGINYYLSMRSKNENWIKYKSEELAIFSSKKSLFLDKFTWRWHSACYPIFTQSKKIFYVNNEKIIPVNILDLLQASGLAVWYVDAFNQKEMSLKTNYLEIVSNYFDNISIKNTIKYNKVFIKDKNKFLSLINPILYE